MVVVLFETRLRPDVVPAEYEAVAQRMMELASRMPGFVFFRYFTSPEGNELSVVQFASEATRAAWRNHPEHLKVQQDGRGRFFASYRVQVCSLLREYDQSGAETASR
jgi:heme-degrading monooxygenase HmoA